VGRFDNQETTFSTIFKEFFLFMEKVYHKGEEDLLTWKKAKKISISVSKIKAFQDRDIDECLSTSLATCRNGGSFDCGLVST